MAKRIAYDQVQVIDEGEGSVLGGRRVVPDQGDFHRAAAVGHWKEVGVGLLVADLTNEKTLVAQLVHGVLNLHEAVTRSEVGPFVEPTRVIVQIRSRVDEQSFHG